MSNVSYERDFYAWANEQAALLRAGRLGDADIANIAEEIESMGRSEKRELVDRFTVLLVHLLKWRYQPGLRGNSWRLAIKEQRFRLFRLLADNPSLKANLDEVLSEGYQFALIGAERETGFPEETFPAECPWSFDQAMDEAFRPE